MVQLNANNIPRIHQVTAKWGWFLAMGIVLLALGIYASMSIVLATAATSIFIAMIMVIAGLAQLINAFSVQSWERFMLLLIAGIIYTAAGVVCFTYPIMAAVIFTFMLGLMLIIVGVLRMIIGFQSKNLTGWGYIVLAGALSAVLGIMIISGWPNDALWMLGIFLSIDLIFQGCGWIAFALGLRTLRKA